MKINVIYLLLVANVIYGQGRYYKAQMHCHSTNSDGSYTPVALVNKYKAAGYEIMMITDHNFLTDSVYVPGVLCIPSEEITFKRHMNGFFLKRKIQPTPEFTCQQAIDSVISQGGLIQLNHYCPGPFTDDDWEVDAPEIISFQNGPHMLEIWNTGTEGVQTHDDKSIWDAVLTAGKVVWGSATDDFHPSVLESLEFNKGWNMIWLDTLTKEAVYDALLNGRFYASTGVIINEFMVNDYGTYKTVSVSSSNATKIKFWGPNHVVLQENNGNSASFILQNHSYVRVELIKEGFLGTGTTYAWTQPVFLQNPTGIEETNDIAEFKIYPNPNKGYANVALTIKRAGNVNISVCTLSGTEILPVCHENLEPNQYIFQVSVAHISSGYYLLKLIYNNTIRTILFEKL
ncbi:MAG: CehA/McbA family metallohydrolase [Bacteroidales bacterium]|nr:CehA/McbA family metallohydrolase [Bacteroidales bacterium]